MDTTEVQDSLKDFPERKWTSRSLSSANHRTNTPARRKNEKAIKVCRRQRRIFFAIEKLLPALLFIQNADCRDEELSDENEREQGDSRSIPEKTSLQKASLNF